MSDIIHKRNYKDRYRTVFCTEDFYIQHQETFALWKTRFARLSDVEKAMAWAISLCCLRRPKDWFGGYRSPGILRDTLKLSHPLTLQSVFSDTPVLLPQKINPEMDLTAAINTLKIKAVPESCFRSLIYTRSGQYPLWVTQHVPTPQELLNLQISGQRVLSFNEDYATWPTTLYSDRDFLGFLLHDLIHADHFFHDPLHRDGQLGFYRFVQNTLNDLHLNRLLQSPRFQEGFEYIISDMNSHPVHLFQTLHSLLFSEVKDDATSARIWGSWSSWDIFSEDDITSLSRVNHRDFTADDARQLELLCIRLGQHSSK